MNKTVKVERNAGNIIIGNSPEYEISSAINELLKLLANKPFTFKKTEDAHLLKQW